MTPGVPFEALAMVVAVPAVIARRAHLPFPRSCPRCRARDWNLIAP